jgi:hypothetical protein
MNNHLYILFTLPITARQKVVNARFVFDTAVHKTYITKSVINALEVPFEVLGEEVFKYNGVKWTDINAVRHSGVY